MLFLLSSLRQKRLSRGMAIILLLALLGAGMGLGDLLAAHQRRVLKESLAAYTLSAKDLAKPAEVRLADGNDYYVSIRNNTPGCTTVSAQHILGQVAGGKVVDVEDHASVTGTFCNTPPMAP